MNSNTFYQLIRRPEVLKLVPRSKSALHLDEKSGLFCPPVAIGGRAVAYIKYEVDAVVKARIEGKSQQEIRDLVRGLLEKRTSNLTGASNG